MIPKYITDLIEKYEEIKNRKLAFSNLLFLKVQELEKELKGILWATKEEKEKIDLITNKIQDKKYDTVINLLLDRGIVCDEIIKKIEEVLK